MAKQIAIPFKELSPRIIGEAGEYRPARIQSFELRGNFPTRDIQEDGNNRLAGTVYDIPDYTVTLNALDVSTKLFGALTGTTTFTAAGVSIDEIGDVDIVGDVKDKSLAEIAKSVFLRKARVQSIRMSYSVDGDAKEEYTLGCTERTWFRSDVVSDGFTAGQSSPATLGHSPLVLKNGNYAMSVILDGEYLEEVADSPATGEYSIDPVGGTISFADTIVSSLVVVYRTTAGTIAWVYSGDETIPAAVTGKSVPVYLAANSIPRVQSININVNLRADAVKEQGNPSIVGYVAQLPEVTGDITVLDTDDELIALLSTGNIDSSDTEFRSCELMRDNDINLEIRLLDPSDPCSTSGNVLKTVYIPNVRITGEGHTTNVGNNVTQTFNFRSGTGELVVYSGARA